MKVRFYGKLAAAMGSHVDMAIDMPCTVAQVRRRLIAARPDLAEVMDDKRIRAIVGESVVADGYQLSPTDELEFLAPVSGG